MNTKIKSIITAAILILGVGFGFHTAFANDIQDYTRGRILLQVQENGEAWYVEPQSKERYYMGRPDNAFGLMRGLGIGISQNDLAKIPVAHMHNPGTDSDNDGLGDAFEDAIGTNKWSNDSDGDGYTDKEEVANGYSPLGAGRAQTDAAFSNMHKGKIFIDVNRHGEAWYIYPDDGKRYFLGRPVDAFNIMRSLGLGINNADLAQVPVSRESAEVHVATNEPEGQGGPDQVTPKSDAEITEFFAVEDTVEVGDTTYVAIQVVNKGNVSTGNIYVELYSVQEDQKVGDWMILEPGHTWEDIKLWTCDFEGIFTIHLTADAYGTADESNESNNTKTITITCTTPVTIDDGQGGPDPDAQLVTHHPATCDPYTNPAACGCPGYIVHDQCVNTDENTRSWTVINGEDVSEIIYVPQGQFLNIQVKSDALVLTDIYKGEVLNEGHSREGWILRINTSTNPKIATQLEGGIYTVVYRVTGDSSTTLQRRLTVDAQPFTTQNILLRGDTFNPEIYKNTSLQEMQTQLNRAYAAMEDLVGYGSFVGYVNEIVQDEELAPEWVCAYAGNPIVLQNSPQCFKDAQGGNPSYVLLHEVGHNFTWGLNDYYTGGFTYSWNKEITEGYADFMAYYIYDTGVLPRDGMQSAMHPYSEEYYLEEFDDYLDSDSSWEDIEESEMVGLLITLKQSYGWGAYRQMFRAYNANDLSHDSTESQRMEYFVGMMTQAIEATHPGSGAQARTLMESWGLTTN